VGGIEEHTWCELRRREATMALAMAAEALAQAGRSRDDVAGGGSQESSAGLGTVRKFLA
jgi:hypothetical protein